MGSNNQISNGLRGIIMLGCLFAVFVTIGLPAISSFAHYVGNHNRVHSVPAEVVRENREATYQKLCPIYAKLTTWEKWTTPYYWDLDWCEDYLDRL